jgi:hypothetical protein
MVFNPLVKKGFDKVGGEETDPIFSASEAALFEAGDKEKLDESQLFALMMG